MPDNKKERHIDDDIRAATDESDVHGPQQKTDDDVELDKIRKKDQVAEVQSVESSGAGTKATRGPESLEDFLRYAYQRNGQRLAFGGPTQKRLAAAAELSEQARRELLLLASEDLRLAVPPQLLLTLISIDAYPALKNSIRDFTGEVLSKHPVFEAKGLIGAIRNLPDAPTEDEAVHAITALNRSELKNIGFGTNLSGPKASEFRRNALNSLFLWFTVTRGRNIDTLIRRGFTEIWGPAADRVRGDAERVRKLLSAKDPSGLGIVGRHFQRRLDMADKEAAKQERLQRKLSAHASELKRERAEAQGEIAKLKAALSGTKSELTSIKRRSESDQIHQQDAYEQLRGRLLGRLKRESDLLEEGLHALRQPKPRVSVMDDHAERVLERIREEITRMESEED